MTDREVKNAVPSDTHCDFAVLARRHSFDMLCVAAGSVLAYVLEAINLLPGLSLFVAASLFSVKLLIVAVFG
jgi:hypothetical protein